MDGWSDGWVGVMGGLEGWVEWSDGWSGVMGGLE